MRRRQDRHTEQAVRRRRQHRQAPTPSSPRLLQTGDADSIGQTELRCPACGQPRGRQCGRSTSGVLGPMDSAGRAGGGAAARAAPVVPSQGDRAGLLHHPHSGHHGLQRGLWFHDLRRGRCRPAQGCAILEDNDSSNRARIRDGKSEVERPGVVQPRGVERGRSRSLAGHGCAIGIARCGPRWTAQERLDRRKAQHTIDDLPTDPQLFLWRAESVPPYARRFQRTTAHWRSPQRAPHRWHC